MDKEIRDRIIDIDQNIKPFHIFQHKGHWCLINIEDMKAQAIDEEMVRVISVLGTKPERPLTSQYKQQLNQLGLIPNPEEQSKKNLKNWIKKEPVPVVNISLCLTQSCNLKCIYCYADVGNYEAKGHMDQKTAYRSVDWLIEQSINFKRVYIGFFGGEPFLKFDLMKKVVEYAKNRVKEAGKKVSFFVNTNGSLLNDEIIAYVEKHNIHVKISFDGPREVQDSQRPLRNGWGTYDFLIPKIKKILKVLPKTAVHATLTPKVDPEIVKKSLIEIGFTEISMLPASLSLLSKNTGKPRINRDTEDLYKQMELESDTLLNCIKNRKTAFLSSYLNQSQFLAPLKFIMCNIKSYYPCGAGLGYVGISVTGAVYLCQRFIGINRYKIGSIFHAELKRKRYLQSPIISNKICATCFARYYCVGGCKYDNISSNGSASIPSEDFCRWRRRQLELAAYIASVLDLDDLDFLTEHKIILPKPCPLDF